MSNEALLIYKKLGLGVESDWAQGTITSATKLLALRDAGIAVGLGQNIIMPKRISGRSSYKSAILGTKAPKLTIPFFGYPAGLGLSILKAAFGQASSAEVASFTVTLGSNDKIDFIEGEGEAKAATITAGTYTSTALCAEIKAVMEAANETDVTYTVAFSSSTKKFTITPSASTIDLLWASGTNALTAADTLLGFSADVTDSAAATSATALEIVYDHTFSMLAANPYGMSVGLTLQIALATGKVYDVLDAVVDVLKMSYKPNQELYFDAEVEARDSDDSSDDLASLTEPSMSPLLYSQLTFTVGGATKQLSSLDVSISNNLKKDMFANAQARVKFPRNDFQEVKGTFTLPLADSDAFDIYDAFVAGTQPELVATFAGATSGIKTGFAYALAATLPKVQYDLDAIPGGGGAAAPMAPIPFRALDDGTNGEIVIVVRNNEATVS